MEFKFADSQAQFILGPIFLFLLFSGYPHASQNAGNVINAQQVSLLTINWLAECQPMTEVCWRPGHCVNNTRSLVSRSMESSRRAVEYIFKMKWTNCSDDRLTLDSALPHCLEELGWGWGSKKQQQWRLGVSVGVCHFTDTRTEIRI